MSCLQFMRWLNVCDCADLFLVSPRRSLHRSLTEPETMGRRWAMLMSVILLTFDFSRSLWASSRPRHSVHVFSSPHICLNIHTQVTCMDIRFKVFKLSSLLKKTICLSLFTSDMMVVWCWDTDMLNMLYFSLALTFYRSEQFHLYLPLYPV